MACVVTVKDGAADISVNELSDGDLAVLTGRHSPGIVVQLIRAPGRVRLQQIGGENGEHWSIPNSALRCRKLQEGETLVIGKATKPDDDDDDDDEF